MTTVDVLKDLEVFILINTCYFIIIFKETFEICYTNTVESFCFFFLDPKHWGKIRITDLLVSGFLETAFGLQNNFEDYENWFFLLLFKNCFLLYLGFLLRRLMK